MAEWMKAIAHAVAPAVVLLGATVDPPAAALGDLGLLLYFEVDELAGRVVSIRRTVRPERRSRSASLETPWRTQIACSVDAGTPAWSDSRADPFWQRRRKATTRRSTRAGVLVGVRRGRLERSSRARVPPDW
jgi:hypothetical protein